MSRLSRIAAAGRGWPIVSLLLAAVAVAAQSSPAVLELLEYDRSAMAAGEVWRVLTCHIAHESWNHLLWDAAALVALGWLSERSQPRRFLIALGTSASAIPLWLWFAMPELATYRGLSGLDSAVFTLLAGTTLLESIQRNDRRWAAAAGLVLLGFLGKIGFECVTGRTLFVDSQMTDAIPIPAVHVIGAALGLAAACWPKGLVGRLSGGRDGAAIGVGAASW